MSNSRRRFLKDGAMLGVAGAIAGASGLHAADAEKKTGAPCGLNCKACALMAAGKCPGCAPGTQASKEMIEKKNCPVLTCANMKGFDHCGAECKGFTMCDKIVGRPYAQSYIDKIKKKLA